MSAQQSSILIGYLSEVRGDGMDARIAEEHSNDSPLIKVGNEEILAGHIGSYVVIRQANIGVLALVFKMWEKDHFNNECRPVPVSDVISICCQTPTGSRCYAIKK